MVSDVTIYLETACCTWSVKYVVEEVGVLSPASDGVATAGIEVEVERDCSVAAMVLPEMSAVCTVKWDGTVFETVVCCSNV